MEAVIRLYLDENLSPRIAEQLHRRGVDAVSVHELGLTGHSDSNHLERAVALGYVLVTADTDFLKMARDNPEHRGIVFGPQEDLSIGDWVARLELISKVYTSEDMHGHIEFL